MDSKVYIFLAKKGLQRALDISRSMKLNKEQLYRSLRKLQKNGVVTATLEHPARFSTVPFGKVLDLFMKAKMDEFQEIQRNKDEIIQIWDSMTIRDAGVSAKFTVIEGRKIINSRIQQMLENSQNRFSIISTASSLLRAHNLGLFEDAFKSNPESKIQFRFLTELTKQNAAQISSFLDDLANTKLRFEGRTPDLGQRLSPSMVIRDDEEILFFISPNTTESTMEKDDACLWTDSKALIRAFTGMFEELWRNASNLSQKLLELKNGGEFSENQLIADAESAQEAYYETLNAAKREIVILTSSEGLIEIWKEHQQYEGWAKNGVIIKVMAPIINKNSEAANQLQKFCSVRHVPFTYLMTTTVDGKYLYQFRNPDTSIDTEPSAFDNLFFTTDSEHVKKVGIMLNSLWRSATRPSSVTIQTLQSYPPSADNSSDQIRGFEEEMRNTSPQKLPKAHTITGTAFISPPSHLGLPRFAIQIYHYDKDSTFGEGNCLDVRLQLKSKKGYSFVQVAAANTNPRSVIPEKALFKGSPAAENYLVVKPEELQVRRQGNTLFGGWTFPIPLPPTEHILPPAALLIEGYGEPRHVKTIWPTSSGRRLFIESDRYDAFVTFLDPSWKYAGPGTQGQLGINVTMNVIAP
jgi:sugar-specific transcriptional regulator TrmB